MTSLYRDIGSVLGCVRPRVCEDTPSTLTATSHAEAEDPGKSESSSPLQPGTPDAMDVRARSPSKDNKRISIRPATLPPLHTPKSGADIASGLRYGVEVEHQGLTYEQVARAVRDNIAGAAFEDGRPYIDSPDGRRWQIDVDAGGLELVTPILRGQADLNLLQKIVASLAKQGAQADERAGLAKKRVNTH